MAHINKVVYGAIKQRLPERDNPELLKTKTDIFSQFLLASDDDGQPLSETYLRDVFMNFLIAGRDTTAALLTWTLYNMCRHPDLAKKVRAEVKQHVVTEVPTADQLLQLTYTKQFMTEVLRLYPSVPLDNRTAVEDDVLPNGIPVKAGDNLMYSPWVMGRLPEVYANPEKFDPDRWSEENVKSMPTGSFTAFHLGPQTCLGKEMAYMEARLALVLILKKYNFTLAEPIDTEKNVVVSVILLPENGLQIQFARRHNERVQTELLASQ
eukprot:TRINITY_DN6884_c0_g1_i1.p1 TRINITY_DN6884_c0_g1~~TRINITY_DN6884_c0_g1_i1.p1  ORF type:complete len:306 (-),score=63.63 TRINITY_DN6884_c0_g1_i1:73-870(-)